MTVPSAFNTAVWTVVRSLLLSYPGSIPSTYKTVRCHNAEKKTEQGFPNQQKDLSLYNNFKYFIIEVFCVEQGNKITNSLDSCFKLL
jgi:hypothetical protein